MGLSENDVSHPFIIPYPSLCHSIPNRIQATAALPQCVWMLRRAHVPLVPRLSPTMAAGKSP